MEQRWARIILVIFSLLSFQAWGSPESLEFAVGQLQQAFVNKGGPLKAVQQLRCFIKKHGHKKFLTKSTEDMVERCKIRDQIAVENERGVIIVDYTKPSTSARMFKFEFKTGMVRALHTAHGRFGETPRNNRMFSVAPPKNSIEKVAHFSNEVGSNATAGGFYLTGQEYQGMYKRSLVLHGLEAGVNDNSCVRATVFHRSSYISDTSTNLMSSGCPMVAMHRIDPLIDLMKDGALVYFYTPAEAALTEEDCGRDLLEVK